jgi:folate-dependent phosphoribosylglycinamide formyltransferase PurN
MKIVIIAMDDPLYTNNFIKQIIDDRLKDIVGFAYVSKGDRLTIGKDRSKAAYLFSLFLIMGPYHFIKNSLITLQHKVRLKLSPKIPFISNPLVIAYARERGIKTFEIKNPNNKNFLAVLNELEPDIIINQSQSILKEDLLQIPKIGVINRHNALLPKNRGRLTPFWVLYKNEKETGVSIHFVERSIDSGDIIIQKRYKVEKKDTFNSLVKRNYEIAGSAMLEALDILETGDYSLIPNDDKLATYNSTPEIKHAWEYKKRRLFRITNIKSL